MDIADEAALVIERTSAVAIARAANTLAEAGTAECIGCGDEIEPSRRAALPSARRCIECQSRVERRDSQRRSFDDLERRSSRQMAGIPFRRGESVL